MALSDKGFKRETYEDIYSRLEAKTKEEFGEDANLSSSSPLGMLMRIVAWVLSLLWQDIENVFYASFQSSATGPQLDALVPQSGVTRDPATHAHGVVEFTGTPNKPVPLGTIVTKEDDTIYYTLADKLIGANGKVLVEIMADEPGVGGNAEVGAINKILNPAEGITAVTNLTAFTNGQESESDVSLRARASVAVEGLGSATTAAIRTEILKIPTVRAVYVDENTSDTVNELGTPPNNVQAIVLGGTEEEVAAAILNKKAGGIRPHGTTECIIKDAAGVEKAIRFTRAEIVDIYVKVRLVTNAEFEFDGEDQVRNAITQYVGGLAPDGANYNGLNMGETVVLSKLLAQIYRVNGINDVEVELSKDNITFSAENIEVAIHEVAQIKEIEVI